MLVKIVNLEDYSAELGRGLYEGAIGRALSNTGTDVYSLEGGELYRVETDGHNGTAKYLFYGSSLIEVKSTEAVPPEKPLTQLVEEKGGLNEDGSFKDSLEVKEPKRAEYYIDGERNPLYFEEKKDGGFKCYVKILDGEEYQHLNKDEVHTATHHKDSLLAYVRNPKNPDRRGLAMWIKGIQTGEADECELLTLEEGERLLKPTPDDEILDGQPLDEGCTDTTCSLDACSGGDCTDAGVMATKIAQQEAQKFAVGAREMKEGEEGIKINLGFNPSGEEMVNVNFDAHYKEAKTDKVGEPIDVIEALEVRLINAGVDINEACNICRGLKYVLRGSFKEGEDVQKELRKFYNYTHRARTGEWLGGKK
jgi:hypothetical protein